MFYKNTIIDNFIGAYTFYTGAHFIVKFIANKSVTYISLTYLIFSKERADDDDDSVKTYVFAHEEHPHSALRLRIILMILPVSPFFVHVCSYHFMVHTV